MKLGKTKLKRILHRETGIPIRDIEIHGQYKYYGNKESIVIGSHTITAWNEKIFLSEPVIHEDSEKITYRTREIEKEKI